MVILLLLVIIAILAPALFFGSAIVGAGFIGWVLSSWWFWAAILIGVLLAIPIAKMQNAEAEKIKKTEKRVSVSNGSGQSLEVTISVPNTAVVAVKKHLYGSEFATTECRESDLAAILNIMGRAGFHPASAPAQMQRTEITNEILKHQVESGTYKHEARVIQTYKIADT